MKTCKTCAQKITDDNLSLDNENCQLCCEEICNQSWWEMVNKIQKEEVELPR